MEDWDLQAIVKGCSRPNSTAKKLMEDPFLSSFLCKEDDFSCVYPQVFEATESSCCSSNEFEGFGSWIYPVMNPLIPNPHNSAITSELLREFKEPQKLNPKKIQIAATKQKLSKKSRQNRIVKEVKAESVCSDSWGWRKYGQKPIKGSPYPRSYYRCSSSKGCSARKQVEQSLSDPDVFIVTYTAEHNHAEPTRRNALAGTTRKKYSTPENPTSFDMVLSPNNSSTSVEQPIMEGVAEGEVFMNMPFEFYSEDLFTGLEDLLYG